MHEPSKPLTGAARAVFDQAIREGYSPEQAEALAALAAASGADRATITETMTLCRMTGAPALAAAFIAHGVPLVGVKAALREALGTDGKVQPAAAEAVGLSLLAGKVYGCAR